MDWTDISSILVISRKQKKKQIFFLCFAFGLVWFCSFGSMFNHQKEYQLLLVFYIKTSTKFKMFWPFQDFFLISWLTIGVCLFIFEYFCPLFLLPITGLLSSSYYCLFTLNWVSCFFLFWTKKNIRIRNFF